jgi:hypothetical protein
MKQLYSVLSLFFFVTTAFGQAPTCDPIGGPGVLCSAPSAAEIFSTTASGAVSYSWMVNPPSGVVITNPTGSVTGISFPNTYSLYTIAVYATNSAGDGPAVFKNVTVYETPQVSFSGGGFVCQGSSTMLSASPTMKAASSTLSFGWTPTAGMTGANTLSVTVTPPVSVIYTLNLALGNCTNSVTYNVTVGSCVGLNKQDALKNMFDLFPNPSNGEITFSSEKPQNINIVNQSGQVVRRIYVFSDTRAILSDLPSGVYFAVSESRRVKFIIARE